MYLPNPHCSYHDIEEKLKINPKDSSELAGMLSNQTRIAPALSGLRRALHISVHLLNWTQFTLSDVIITDKIVADKIVTDIIIRTLNCLEDFKIFGLFQQIFAPIINNNKIWLFITHSTERNLRFFMHNCAYILKRTVRTT